MDLVVAFTCGFLTLQAHGGRLVKLLGMMTQKSPFPCFQGKDPPESIVKKLRCASFAPARAGCARRLVLWYLRVAWYMSRLLKRCSSTYCCCSGLWEVRCRRQRLRVCYSSRCCQTLSHFVLISRIGACNTQSHIHGRLYDSVELWIKHLVQHPQRSTLPAQTSRGDRCW